MPAWLFALLAATFVYYTDDYVIAGILPELAADLRIQEGQAGQLVTAFSLTVAVAAPIAAVVTARLSRHKLFTAAMLIFISANLTASISSSFALLLALRIVAALSAAAATPALFAFVANHAPEAKLGKYLAIVSLGVTGAIAAGVPVGAWIGGALGWRATFLVIAVAGIIALVSLLFTLPRSAEQQLPVALPEQLRILRRPPIFFGLLANCLLMTGSMMMLTYLAPYLEISTTADLHARALAFSLSGIAGIIGIWLGGIATDSLGADRTLLIGIGALIVSMLALWGFWAIRPVPLVLVLAVVTFWGGLAFWNSPAIQVRLYQLAGPVTEHALALNTSGTYLGVAIGAAIGGQLLTLVGMGVLPLVAGAFATGALLCLHWAQSFTQPT